MFTRDTRSIEELEAALKEAGMPDSDMASFKTKIKETHMASANAQKMPGASSDIMKIALEWDCRLEVKMLLRDFGDKYHIWVAENEAVIATEDFETAMRKFANIIPKEEIEVVLKKMQHTASQCKDPRSVKYLYAVLWRHYIIPNIPTLDAEKLHGMVSSFLAWLTGKCDEMGDDIVFRKSELIEAWLELEENVWTQKSNPASLQLLKAVRERDTETLKKLMGTPDGKRFLEERTYCKLLPHLTEQLD